MRNKTATKPRRHEDGNSKLRIYNFFVPLCLCGLFLFSGCQGNNSSKKGGLAQKADFEFSCIAKFLIADGSSKTAGSNGSWYLTEQNCRLYFESTGGKQSRKPLMTVEANEPGGNAAWTVSEDNVVIGKKPKTIADKKIFELMTNEAVSSAMLGLFLVETKPANIVSGQGGNFLFQGRKYYFAGFFGKNTSFYKAGKDGKVCLAVTEGKKRYVLYGYNYIKLENGGSVPSKIDVYGYENPNEIAQYVIFAN
ncbi:MAG: hypothetical protein WC770_00190 [Phycisphaerae bacterium]|jgi:hypothetical protein